MDAIWTLTNHCCRVCFSRLVSRPDEGGRTHYRCTGCGIDGTADHPRVICSCGLKLRNGKDMGVRCVLNDQVTPEVPFQVVARQIESGR